MRAGRSMPCAYPEHAGQSLQGCPDSFETAGDAASRKTNYVVPRSYQPSAQTLARGSRRSRRERRDNGRWHRRSLDARALTHSRIGAADSYAFASALGEEVGSCPGLLDECRTIGLAPYLFRYVSIVAKSPGGNHNAIDDLLGFGRVAANRRGVWANCRRSRCKSD